MIYYFSGTGNSEWVAKQLAAQLCDEAVNVMDVMNESLVFSKADKVGLVYPVYAWAPPEVVLTFAKKLKGTDAYVYGVCTYAGEPGHAMKILGKSVHLDSAFGLLMPSNYVIGMSLGSEKESIKKIENAQKQLGAICEAVSIKACKDDIVSGGLAGLKSSVAAAAFNQFGRKTKPFRTLESCNNCGLCARICPAKTITMSEEKPVWGKTCYQCLACINRCPQQAIEYGNLSVGKGRYYFEKISSKCSI